MFVSTLSISKNYIVKSLLLRDIYQYRAPLYQHGVRRLLMHSGFDRLCEKQLASSNSTQVLHP